MMRSGTTISSPRGNPDWLRTLLTAMLSATVIAIVMYLPAGTRYQFGSQSDAIGLAMAIPLILLLLWQYIDLSWQLVKIGAVALVIVVHLLISALVHDIEVIRTSLSLVLLVGMFLMSRVLANWLAVQSDETMRPIILVLRATIVIIGMASILGIQPRGELSWPKPVYPFTEPSHFALAFTPLLIDAVVRSPEWQRYLWLLLGLFFAYQMQNITIIAGVGIAAAVSLPLTRFIPAIVAFLIAIGFLDIEYFTSRLDISARSDNLSVLIYVQGWEMIADAFDKTWLWGLGFQQLGQGYINSVAAFKIYQLNQIELNRLDGSFLVSKLVSEFGVFGAMLVSAMTLYMVRSGLLLRKIAAKTIVTSRVTTYTLSIVCAYFVDTWIRGTGYFNGSAPMFIAACLVLWDQSKPRQPAASSYTAS